MQNSKNVKLGKNIVLMFLVYFFPKIFSFFLVPLYTSYLTTEEYGISDIIISTASLLAPFIALSTPSAVMRFTIENKEDKRPLYYKNRVNAGIQLLSDIFYRYVYINADTDRSKLYFWDKGFIFSIRFYNCGIISVGRYKYELYSWH